MMMDPSANKDDIPKRLADALTAFFDMDCPGPFIGMLRCKCDSAPYLAASRLDVCLALTRNHAGEPGLFEAWTKGESCGYISKV
jgi:hypothetical protein